MTEKLDLLGVAELAELLNVSTQRASELRHRRGFPPPVAILAMGPIWLRDHIDQHNTTWRRTPGRPKNQPPTSPNE